MTLAAALIATQPDGTATDPLAGAIKHYATLESYRVTIRSSHDDDGEHIRYFYRKPGFVRMEFVHPHEGAVLVYNPFTRRVRLWPFGAGHFPEFNLSPGNPLIRSSRGQQVDRSDIGALLENVRILRAGGSAEMVAEENADGHALLHLAVTGANGTTVAGVHRYELWLDTANHFPVKVISRDLHDVIIETVMLDAPEINATLPDELFNP